MINIINNQQFTYVVKIESIDLQIAYNFKRINKNIMDGNLLNDLNLKSITCHFLT